MSVEGDMEDSVVVGLIEVMEQAIRSGDWVVDGACDPDSILNHAKQQLRERGWVTDGITGETWFKED